MKKSLFTYVVLLLIAIAITGAYQLSAGTFAGTQSLFFESVGNLFIIMMAALAISIPVVILGYLWASSQ